MTDVHGYAEEGWGPVVDAFRAGFDNGDELGASCCIYDGGRPVVDIWAGIADKRTQRPWTDDTVAVVYSTTKGAAALCLMRLVERGEVDLEAPVAKYWPEYAANGKEDTIVRHFLNHEAGVPDVDGRLTLEQACAWDPVIRALEGQKPLWTPGEHFMYHALMSGFLVGEIVRRVTGKSIGTFFAAEVAGPLGLSAWIGLPESVEPRVAHMDFVRSEVDHGAVFDLMVDRLPPASKAKIPAGARDEYIAIWSERPALHTIGGAFTNDDVRDHHNSRMVRAAEFPASNMVCDARSLARMYAAAVGAVDGVSLLRPETIEMILSVKSASTAFSLPAGMQIFPELAENPYSLGFWRLADNMANGVGPRMFGHPGAGGSLGAGDPDTGLSFGYVMNHMAQDSARATELVAAMVACAR